MKYRTIFIIISQILLITGTFDAIGNNLVFFETLKDLPYSDVRQFGEGLAPAKQNGMWGYMDKSGQIVISPQFEDAAEFSEGLAKVTKSGKIGFIDKTGTFIIEPQFSQAQSFSEGLAYAEQNGKCGYIDKSGKFKIRLMEKYDWCYPFKEGMARIYHNNKWSYVNTTGKLLLSGQFKIVNDFSEGLACVMQNGKYGFIDKTGKIIIALQFDNAKSFGGGLAPVSQNNKDSYIDKTGQIVFTSRYRMPGTFNREGLALVHVNGKWGFIDKADHLVIPAQYDEYCYFNDGYALVEKDNKKFFIGTANDLNSFVNAQIGTLDDFLMSKGITLLNEEEIQSKVERIVSQWQKKGEFETTDEWKQRVNEQTRTTKARGTAERIIGEYNKKLMAAREEYREKYDRLANEYCHKLSEAFTHQEFTLKPFDADNQTYLISTANYGDILLPVPLDEALAFKNNWDDIKNNVLAVFVRSGKDAALQSVKFDKYIYDSNTKADYAMLDVEYNQGWRMRFNFP